MASNKIFAEWVELMSDKAVVTAMLDRLLHHAHAVSLKADSYRMKERLRVGVANTVGSFGFEQGMETGIMKPTKAGKMNDLAAGCAVFDPPPNKNDLDISRGSPSTRISTNR
jgi:hypothetical protein